MFHSSALPVVNHKITNRGTLLAVVSSILYSSLGYLGITQMHPGFTVYDMLFWRFIVAGILLLPFALRVSVWTKMDVSSAVWLFLLGGSTYGGSSLFYFLAAQNLGTGISMVIFFAFPVFVALLAWVFDRHRLGRLTYVSMITLFCGLWLLGDECGPGFHWMAAFLALSSGVTYAVYVYMGKKIKVTPIASSLIVCFGSAFTIWCTDGLVGSRTFLPSFQIPWLYVFLTAMLATVLPIILLLEALKKISATKASLLSVFEPLSTVIIGIMFLGESVTDIQTVGIIIVLVGALLTHYDR